MVRFGMLGILWVATGAIAYLATPDSWYSNPKYWLSLGTLFFAQALFFTGGILRRRAAWGSAAAEADSGGFFIGMFYLPLVCVLGLIALTPIAFNFLLILHIILGVPLTFGWLLMTGARQHLSAGDERRSVAMTPTGAPPAMNKTEPDNNEESPT